MTLSTGLEADKVEVLLLELLYKTDYSNDFDREVRVPRGPLRALGGCAVCVPVCVPCLGLFPTRLLSPADSLPSGATPAGVEQRHRAEKTTKHPWVPGPGVFWPPHGLFPEPCSHPAPRPLSRAPSHLPTTLHASQRR